MESEQVIRLLRILRQVQMNSAGEEKCERLIYDLAEVISEIIKQFQGE